jgi:hypothetical protein
MPPRSVSAKHVGRAAPVTWSRRLGPVAATTLAMLLAGVSPAIAMAAQSFEVTIQPPGYVSGDTANAGELYPFQFTTPDVMSQSYPTPGGDVTVTGYSLYSGITQAISRDATSANPFGWNDFTFAEVSLGGNFTVITEAQAMEQGGTPGAPVFWIDSQGAHFADSNPSDYFTVPNTSSGSAGVTLLDGPDKLNVQTTIPQTTGTDVPVTFTASASSADPAVPGSSIQYQWYENGGSVGYQPTLTQTFCAPGTYDLMVLATTTADGGSAGVASASIQVNQGSACPNQTRTGTSTTKTAPTITTVPKKKKKKAPTKAVSKSGVHKTPTHTTTTPTPTNTTPGTSTAATGAGTGTTPQPPTPPKPGVTQPATAKPAKRPPPRHVKRRARPTGPLLSGEAVVLGNAPDGAASPLSATGQTAAPGVLNPVRKGRVVNANGAVIPLGVWIAIGVLLSLGLGALLQTQTGDGPLRRSWS